MHPEIEKLIDLALADGQITEKEKAIILRKAEKLGEDIDEVEMILEGKLSKLAQTKNKEQSETKQGLIKKCPHCGARTNSFGNGRVVRNLFEKIVENQSNRLAMTEGDLNDHALKTLISEDFPN